MIHTTSLLFPRTEDGIRLIAIRPLRGGTSPGGSILVTGPQASLLSRGLAAWADGIEVVSVDNHTPFMIQL